MAFRALAQRVHSSHLSVVRCASTAAYREALLQVDKTYKQKFTYHADVDLEEASGRPLVILIGWLNSQQVSHTCCQKLNERPDLAAETHQKVLRSHLQPDEYRQHHYTSLAVSCPSAFRGRIDPSFLGGSLTPFVA